MSITLSITAHSIIKHPFSSAISRILSSALSAVDPSAAVRNFLRIEKGILCLGNLDVPESLLKFDPGQYDRIKIIGFGKAALPMSAALMDVIQPICQGKILQGLIIGKHQPDAASLEYFENMLNQFEFIAAGHPIPNENSISAGQKIGTLLADSTETDLVICLISGGGSALITLPYPGISLVDFQALTAELLASGARIDEINCLRRHLDQVKGGGIVRMASPAAVISLILSDVVGSPLEAIASGPTAPDPSTNQDALSILKKYKLLQKTPLSILEILKRETDTPKPGDFLFSRVNNILVGNNYLACMAAVKQANKDGFSTLFLGDSFQGEARDVSAQLLNLCKTVSQTDGKLARPFCLIAGGETTVTLNGKGMGGRNQELALAAVKSLSEISNSMLITMGTDGEDGPVNAAGAVVTSETLEMGQRLGMDFINYLENNDSYHYFQKLDDLLITGPTGTNVNDLTFIFRF